MKNFESFALSALVTLLCASASFAGPASPFVLDFKQPDGTAFKARLVGDEHFNYTQTADGYIVVKDLLGYYSYANETGESSRIYARNAEDRDDETVAFLNATNQEKIVAALNAKRDMSAKYDYGTAAFKKKHSAGNGVLRLRAGADIARTTGEKNVLVVLMQYPDLSFSMKDPVAEYTDYFNKEGYSKNSNTGSVRDYFLENSMEKLDLTFDVTKPVTLSKKKAEYGYSKDAAFGGEDAVREALDSLIARKLDFSKYDNDKDGEVDFVVAIYAGTSASWGVDMDAIWPHQGFIEDFKINKSLSFNKYACTNEINGYAHKEDSSTKTMEGIGIIVHEFSHMLGLADIYDTYKSVGYIGTWDLMDEGEYNCTAKKQSACTPPNYSAFERMYMGWLEPTEITKAGNFTLKSISTNTAYIINSTEKNEDQFHLLEYRSHKGFDKAQATHGMLIWKIDFDEELWNVNKINFHDNYHIDIAMSNAQKQDTTKKSYVFPGAAKITEFGNFSSLLYKNAGFQLSKIAEAKDSSNVTFTVTKKEAESQITSKDTQYPVVMIQFSDKTFKKENDSYKVMRYLNQEGYSDKSHFNGSVRDYFIDNSSGKLKPFFKVYGPVTLSNEEKYYTDKGEKGIREAFNEALDSLSQEGGIDYALFDSDKNDTLDFIHGIFAGLSQFKNSSKKLIHSAALSISNNDESRKVYDNLFISKFSMTSELDSTFADADSSSSTMAGIGYFVYEFSKNLGLSASSINSNYSIYQVMATGYANCSRYASTSIPKACLPCYYSAYERMQLGWLEPKELTTSGTKRIGSVSNNEAFTISNPKNKKEYYLIEKRGNASWDASFGKTIIVWYVDGSDPSKVSINGKAALSMMEDADYFKNFIWKDGTNANITINNVSYDNTDSDYMTFSLKLPGESSSSQKATSSSSSAKSSSSKKTSSSSSKAKSSSSKKSGIIAMDLERPQIQVNTAGRTLLVHSAPTGVKTVHVFSMTGNLLYSGNFKETTAQISLPQELQNTPVIVQIKVNGEVLVGKRLNIK